MPTRSVKPGRSRVSSQRGAALLALMLVIIVGAASMLLSGLSSSTNVYARASRTQTALAEAKMALLAYAAQYPDICDPADGATCGPTKGPGLLPCPDQDATGDEGSSDNCGTAITKQAQLGKLPFRALGLPDLRDAGGERLWYAVSDNFKHTLADAIAIINSETPAGLINVDGSDDIVAVIIAPGEAVTGQGDRPGYDASDYLELENVTDDGVFISSDPDITDDNSFNDQVLTITRQELLERVQPRVLAALDEALGEYRAAHDAYPWLSAFADPTTSTFKGQVGQIQGHLPYHWSGDPADGTNDRNPFATPITWSWTDILNANVSATGTVDASCVRNLNCSTGPFQGITSIQSSADVDCTWTNKETVDCTASTTVFTTSPYSYTLLSIFPCTGTLRRTYTVNFPAFSGDVAIHNPTGSALRLRDVSPDVTMGPYVFDEDRANAVVIADTFSGTCTWGTSSFSISNWSTGSGSAAIIGGTTTVSQIAATSIKYDLDVDEGELLEWFVANEWPATTYVAYADGFRPGGLGTCVAGTDCLTVSVDWPATSETSAEAVVVAAGSALASKTRPSTSLTDYLDIAEADAVQSGVYDGLANFINWKSDVINDQVRLISP